MALTIILLGNDEGGRWGVVVGQWRRGPSMDQTAQQGHQPQRMERTHLRKIRCQQTEGRRINQQQPRKGRSVRKRQLLHEFLLTAHLPSHPWPLPFTVTHRGTVGTSSKKPAQYTPPNAVFIFDWDDTILCTTYLSSFQFIDIGPENKALLTRLDDSSNRLLSRADLKGQKIYIITNAAKGWVEYSSKVYSSLHVATSLKHTNSSPPPPLRSFLLVLCSARSSPEIFIAGKSRPSKLSWKMLIAT